MDDNKIPEPPSYHDLHITTEYIPRTSIFDLPYQYRVVCSRIAGWELHELPGNGEWQISAGEYDSVNGLRLDVNGVVICDSLTKKVDHEPMQPDS